MWTEEKSFLFRISLEARFPDDYEGPHDDQAWQREWEQLMKPALIKQLFETLRTHPDWQAHVRNRGISAADEIEVALVRDFSTSPQP